MARTKDRGLADLRAMSRKRNLQKILARKRRSIPETTGEIETSAIVMAPGRGVCTVFIEGESRPCRCELPAAAGDIVSIRHERVIAIAPRRTTLSRTDPANPYREIVFAANIDLLVIVAAIRDPPFRPGLVDRYLIAATRGDVLPILCINKIDLSAETAIADVWRQMGVPTISCSTVTDAGIDDLRDLLAGSLVVFAGHSGVGKSSLINTLAGDTEAPVGAVNDRTGKGRQTTTLSRLYELRNGARIIDTPGIREFGLGHVSLPELKAAFADFAALPCRFRDCTHRTEPECAVRAGLASGIISASRYAAYLRIAAELQ